MRILKMLCRNMTDVSNEMYMNYRSFERKFWWRNPVYRKDYEKSIKPYVLKYIDELKDEIEFLDIYFKENDKLKQQWVNEYSRRARWIWRLRWEEWDKRFDDSKKRAREEARAKTKSFTRRAKGRKVNLIKNKAKSMKEGVL